MIEKKNIIFAGRKLNWDDDLDIMPSGDSRDRLDIVYPDGNINVIESRRELNLVIADTLSGTSTCIGSCPDVENNAIIYALYNASNNHSIYRIARTGSGYTRTLISTSSAWGFSLSYPIKDMFVIGTGSEAMLFMTDGYNPQRLFNIANMIAGSYSAMTEAQINLLKPAPTKRPAVSVTDDAIYDRNNIDRKTFQFAYKYIYDTGQKTQLSHYSDLVYDYGRESVSGDFDPTKGENNRILVTSYRDWINVDKIELYVRIGDIGSGTLGSWKLYDTIENQEQREE